MMTLLLQLNGDLPERFPGHERKLYIFSCRRKACRKKEGTIRAIRGIRIPEASSAKTKASNGTKLEPEKEVVQKQATSNLGNSLFNSTFASTNFNSNPFSATSSQTALANPFSPQTSPPTASPLSSLASKPPQPPTTDLSTASLSTTSLSTTFAAKARISSPPPPPQTPWPPHSALPTPYPSYHLDADYESLEPDPPSSTNPTMDIDTDGSSKKDDEKDAFESTIDKTFQKFADRLAQNPEQILRYEFSGSPLLYSKTGPVGTIFSPPSSTPSNTKIRTLPSGASAIPRCQNCAATRVFELQLVPQAIAELEVEEVGLDGMEWGTVILGVCERDCGERGVREGEMGWVEGWVGVQWEEEGGRGSG